MNKKLIALVLVVSSVAFAQTEPKSTSKPKPQTITFGDGLEIGGDTLLPNSAYIQARNPPRFDSLIKVRADFNDKLANSVYEM